MSADSEDEYDDYESEDEHLSRYGVQLDNGEEYALCLPPLRRRAEDRALYAPCMYTQRGTSLTVYVSAPGIHTMQGPMPTVRLFKKCHHRTDELQIR